MQRNRNSKKEPKGNARNKKHSNRNKECLWWFNQWNGHSQVKNQWAWRYVSRTSQTKMQREKRKKTKTKTTVTEYSSIMGIMKGVTYA